MAPRSLKTSKPFLDWAMLAGSAAAGAWSICGWLSDTTISGALWPTEINAAFVSALGGSTQRNAVGSPVAFLPILSVFWRLLLLTALLAAVVRSCSPNREERRQNVDQAVRQTSILFLVMSFWWLDYVIAQMISRSVSDFLLGILPLWISLSAGFFLWIWCRAFVGPPGPDVVKPTTSRLPFVSVAAVMAIWTAVSFWMNYCLYQQLFIPHGDSAMYEEHLWNLWHGKGFRSYLDQGLFLGEHIQVIHLLLLPLHVLWPSHLLLELTESIALSSCAIPIYLMTKRKTGSPWAGTMLAVAWLFYFPMHYLDIAIDLKTFRPIALGLPFLFWLIEFVERGKFVSAGFCLVIALSAKEDIALVTFPLLAILALQAKSNPATDRAARVPALMSVFSVVYLLIVVLFLIPAFRSGDVVHYSRYFGDLGNSPGDLVRTAISEPGKVLAQAMTWQTLTYLLVFLAPLAFLPVRKSTCLLGGALTFVMLSLLQFGEGGGLPPVPYHHFHAPLLPIVFWAASTGLRQSGSRVTDSSKEQKLLRQYWGRDFLSSASDQAALALCCSMATAVTGSLMPCGLSFWSAESGFGYQQLYVPIDPAQQERAAMVPAVLAMIPENARVASTDFIHTRLTHRDRSYDYSNYLRKVNEYKRGVPPDTDYIVIDTRHRYSEIRRAADVPELEDGSDWILLPDETNGAFLILKRSTTTEQEEH